MSNPCVSWLGWRRCNFEARYDFPGEPRGLKTHGYIQEEVIAYMTECLPKTYVHDVCTRCGKLIKRGES